MKLFFRTPERLLQVEGDSSSINYLDRKLDRLAKLEGKEPNQILGEDEHPSTLHHSSRIQFLEERIKKLDAESKYQGKRINALEQS